MGQNSKGSGLSDNGGWWWWGGHPDPEVREGGRSAKISFALRASVWSKNNGGGGWGAERPPGPSAGSATAEIR